MLDQVKEKINLGYKERVIAFFILYGIVYGIIWAATEPLNLDIINSNKNHWRLILIIGTLIVTLSIYFFLLFSKDLEKFGLHYNDTNLQTTVRSSGFPVITIETDGFHGKVFTLKADYDKDEMTWDLKASAHQASFLTIIYQTQGRLTFYIRISIISKDKSTTKLKWIRFEPTISIPDAAIKNEEIGYPLKVVNNDNFLQTTINIREAVKHTFAKAGWQFDKVLQIRARGNGKIKSMTLK